MLVPFEDHWRKGSFGRLPLAISGDSFVQSLSVEVHAPAENLGIMFCPSDGLPDRSLSRGSRDRGSGGWTSPEDEHAVDLFLNEAARLARDEEAGA